MTHRIARLALALGLASLGQVALAATYYVSDCRAGAAPGCIPGSATNNGLSVGLPKQLATQLPKLQGGDTVRFAKGGAWTDASMNIFVPTASAALPVTWDSYDASWGATAKPILTESRAGRYLFNFSDAGVKAADGGYVIRNLDLRGGGAGGARGGIFLYFAVNDVLMEDLDVSGFTIGVYAAHNPKAADGWENHRITLRNSHIHHNTAFGFLGGAADLLIENNRLDHNGTRAMFDHDLYLSSATRALVRGNTLTDSVLDSNGNCSGSTIVVHGGVDGLTIENNKILQRQGSIPQCFGIEVSGGYADSSGSEYFHDVLIRGNTIVDVGYLGIGVRGCTRCVVENNQVIWTGKGGSQAISMSVNTPSSSDELGTALTIRNNSIFMQDASGSPGAIRLLNEGSGHSVTSNLIMFGTSTAASAKCFDTAAYPIGSFQAFDNNLCVRAGGVAAYSANFASLAAAQSAGFDVHGLGVDPLLVALPTASNDYGLSVRIDSPVAGKGHQTRSAPTDIHGQARGSNPDIGAYQLGSSSGSATAPRATPVADKVPPAAPVVVRMRTR